MASPAMAGVGALRIAQQAEGHDGRGALLANMKVQQNPLRPTTTLRAQAVHVLAGTNSRRWGSSRAATSRSATNVASITCRKQHECSVTAACWEKSIHSARTSR